MTDFKSEMRKEIAKPIIKHCSPLADNKILNKDIDVALSFLLALIEKGLPKEKECSGKDNEYEQGCESGFNSCLSEIKKGMGI